MLRLLAGAFALDAAAGLLLPGVLPTSYREGAPVGVKVNSLRSSRHLMPFEWYSLPFCAPPRADRRRFARSQNIGELLWGDKVEISLYGIEMLRDVSCRPVCPPREYTELEMAQFENRIEQEYRGNLLLDGLPVVDEDTVGSRAGVRVGFPLGQPRSKGGRTVLHNHLAFTVLYHAELVETETVEGQEPERTYRVVGFRVKAAHRDLPCTADKKHQLAPADPRRVSWTYSVKWVETDWSSRWDVYVRASPAEAQVHWFAVFGSLTVVLALSASVAVFLQRQIRRDLWRWEELMDIDLGEDNVPILHGWREVHGDVFRVPDRFCLLSVYVGSGVQLWVMSACAVGIAAAGLASPGNRRSLLNGVLVLFALVGPSAGYTSSRLLKAGGVTEWKWIFATAFYLPGQVFLLWSVLNLIMWAKHSASAVSFGTVMQLMGLWLGVSVVLVVLGATFGFRKYRIEFPCKTKKHVRLVPPQPWYLAKPQSVILPGLLPFLAAFFETKVVLSSLWQGHAYHVFGFLAAVLVILAVTVAETAIVMTYLTLSAEDHHWWWRAFFTGGSWGVWLFLYSMTFAVSLHISSFWSAVVYVAYSAMLSYFSFVVTGTIGFLASFWFVRALYSCPKHD